MDQLEEKYKRHNRLPFVDNKLRLHCRQNKDRLLPSGVIYELSKEQLEYFVHFNSQTRLRHMIVELHHRDENLNAMIETYREGKCGDPGLPIRNTRYAYNSRSHDQCVVNPHIRVDNRIISSITVPNNILTIGHMTKYDIAMQGKSTTKQRIPSSVDGPRHAYYPIGN
jgi:hypothetical protein